MFNILIYFILFFYFFILEEKTSGSNSFIPSTDTKEISTDLRRSSRPIRFPKRYLCVVDEVEIQMITED